MTPRDFIDRYYAELQDDRLALSAYYTDDSVLMAKGNENRGREAIAVHFANVPKLKMEPRVISEQKTGYGPHLLVINGLLRHEDGEGISFTETFLVTLPDSGSDIVVHNQAFFFNAT